MILLEGEQYYAIEDKFYFTVTRLEPLTIFVHYEREERVLEEAPLCVLSAEKHGQTKI